MFGWEFPPFNSGGLGVACLGLTKALARRQAEIIFVLPRRLSLRADFLRFLFADTGDVTFRGIDTSLVPYLSSENYLKGFRNKREPGIYGGNLFDEVRRYAERAKVIARRENFDLIHAHDWLSFLAGLEAKKISGRPLIVHLHATEFDRTGGHNVNQFVYEIERRGLQEADRVIAVSELTKKVAVEKYGIPPSKIEVVYNGIDSSGSSALAPASSNVFTELKEKGHQLVVFVGRITIQKGPDYFLRAAKKVSELKDGVVFVMAGAGDMMPKIIRETANLGIANKVFFAGFLRGEELASLYRAADLFVMPSISEPFGITPLEAIKEGTPVLISKQSGVSEVLVNALKVDFWDVDEIANKILAVLNYRSLPECLSSHSRKELPGINWDRAADNCLAIYGKVLASH